METRKYPTHELREFSNANELWDALSPTQKIDPNCVDNIVYRGQADSEWKLIPSVLREKPPFLTLGFEATADELVANEVLLISSFVKNCDRIGIRVPGDSQHLRSEHLDIGKQDKFLINPSLWPNPELLDVMAMAQHHGVPTRLLDWTRLAYTAFYFATSSCLANYKNWKKDSKLAIWALNTELLSLHPSIILHVSAGSVSPHLAAQYGLFTVHPNNGRRGEIIDIRSLEDLAEDSLHPIFFKYTLPISEVFQASNLLYKAGFSAADIYPSADGAGKAIYDEINYEKARRHIETL